MNILITNDDGILAPGIKTLAKVLGEVHRVFVCAPDHERSASSHRATFFLKELVATPVKMENVVATWALDGTTADCVYVGLRNLIEEPIDVIVSGVNRGWNVSYDCHYSATVAGAFEGLLREIPSMAISLASFRYEEYTTASLIARDLLEMVKEAPFSKDVIWNVNVPAYPLEEIKGIRVVDWENRQLYRHMSSKVIQDDGSILMKIESPSNLEEEYIGTYGDISAIEEGYVSISLLQLDWTKHPYHSQLQDLLKEREGKK